MNLGALPLFRYDSAAFSRPRDEAGAQQYDRLLSTLLGWILVLLPNFR